MFLSVTLNGLMIGGLYTLMGTGLSLQWGISGIINLSYGGMIVLGSYISFQFFHSLGIQPMLSAIPAALILFLLGLAMYQFLLRPTMERAPLFVTLIMTFAIGLILENFMLYVWSSDYRMITSPYSNLAFRVLGLHVPFVKAVIFVLSLVCVFLVYLFMMKTRTGKAIQASCLNPKSAQVIGINVAKMYAINFGLGSAIGALGGALASNISAFSVVLTGTWVLKAFIISILGGLGNILGAALGGLTLGLVESYASVILGPEYNEAVGLVVMVTVLVFRPRGLIGRKFWDV
jgi:branched-chain amino acid transport system permease protein